MAPATDELDEASGGESEPKTSAGKRLGTLVAGTYRIKRHIGSGGSSHVFEAEHVRLAKPFAVKLLRPELDATRLTAQRFRREARAIAKLQNEHIVNVVDCGELDDGTPYLVMELLEGEDLRSLLNREGALPARRAVQIVIEACHGLTAVHGAGLVHRDLKPENLFITRRSTGEDWCKVLDFGVAKMDASLSTAKGAIIGTVRYMAPEQLSDGASVGPATDVYALGAVLYECLSGEPVHDNDTFQELMFSVMNREPLALVERCPSVPRSLADTVSRSLLKHPSDRPQSALELSGALAAAFDGADGAAQRSTAPTLSEGRGVHPPPQALKKLPAASARIRGLVPLVLGACLGLGIGWIGKPKIGHDTVLASSTAEAERKIAHSSVDDTALPPASALPAASVPAASAGSVVTQSAVSSPVRSPTLARATVRQKTEPTAPAAPDRSPGAAAPTPRSTPVAGFDALNPYGE